MVHGSISAKKKKVVSLYREKVSVSLSYPVIVNLFKGLVADGALEDHSLESGALVAGHQLHTEHLSFSNSHITEHLCVTYTMYRC